MLIATSAVTPHRSSFSPLGVQTRLSGRAARLRFVEVSIDHFLHLAVRCLISVVKRAVLLDICHLHCDLRVPFVPLKLLRLLSTQLCDRFDILLVLFRPDWVMLTLYIQNARSSFKRGLPRFVGRCRRCSIGNEALRDLLEPCLSIYNMLLSCGVQVSRRVISLGW